MSCANEFILFSAPKWIPPQANPLPFSLLGLPPEPVRDSAVFLCVPQQGSLASMLLKPSDPAFWLWYVDMLFMPTSALTVSPLSRWRTSPVLSRPYALDSWTAVGNESPVASPGYVVSGYVAIFHLLGTSLLLACFAGVSRARGMLQMKGNDVFLCCLSATVSSFANGGLIATNENLAIFNKDPVVLLLMIAQVLGGNTLFALFLRWVMRALKKLTGRDEFKCMLKSTVGCSTQSTAS
ncbi:hypothetical protein GW17_00022180 [Ensete ventricosum]|nr:hypothetical protein GW17_00022180 [Ensete ventricosum]